MRLAASDCCSVDFVLRWHICNEWRIFSVCGGPEKKPALIGLLLRPHEAQCKVRECAVHHYHADECERVVTDPVGLEGEIFDDVIATESNEVSERAATRDRTLGRDSSY